MHLSPLGEERLPTFHNVDFRVDKAVKIKAAKITFSADVFNVMNADIIQGRRRTHAERVEREPHQLLSPPGSSGSALVELVVVHG